MQVSATLIAAQQAAATPVPPSGAAGPQRLRKPISPGMEKTSASRIAAQTDRAGRPRPMQAQPQASRMGQHVDIIV